MLHPGERHLSLGRLSLLRLLVPALELPRRAAVLFVVLGDGLAQRCGIELRVVRSATPIAATTVAGSQRALRRGGPAHHRHRADLRPRLIARPRIERGQTPRATGQRRAGHRGGLREQGLVRVLERRWLAAHGARRIAGGRRAAMAFALWKTLLERTTLQVLVNEVERVAPERLSETGKRLVRGLLSHTIAASSKSSHESPRSTDRLRRLARRRIAEDHSHRATAVGRFFSTRRSAPLRARRSDR